MGSVWPDGSAYSTVGGTDSKLLLHPTFLPTMTHQSLEPYMAGPYRSRFPGIVFRDQKECWHRIGKLPAFESAESLAKWFTENADLFEHVTDEGTAVHEDMVTLGITQFYHKQAGFLGTAEKAWRVFRAFQMSGCSQELRLLVLEVAATLHLGEAYRSSDNL
jgi:hypothetical protein